MKKFTAVAALATVFAVLAGVAGVAGAAAQTAAPAAAAATSTAITYTADKAHTHVGFTIRHMMSQVRGSFGEFSGTIVKDDANLAAASVEFKIQATSIDTSNENRDKHLRSEDFFFVEKFPEITFKSTKVEKVSDSEYKVTGDFTMRGVTKVVTLPVVLTGEMKTKEGKSIVGFSVATKLDRKEYGINWNRALDNGGLLLSDEVAVEINMEAKQGS
ncbi:MAG: YceI family protein [Thermoanaerobaculia bacterium]|jgi:polyisoprenoid-binding protein YceI|nr:YceI family protein [Thermoanaerobaculia bacterium]